MREDREAKWENISSQQKYPRQGIYIWKKIKRQHTTEIRRSTTSFHIDRRMLNSTFLSFNFDCLFPLFHLYLYALFFRPKLVVFGSHQTIIGALIFMESRAFFLFVVLNPNLLLSCGVCLSPTIFCSPSRFFSPSNHLRFNRNYITHMVFLTFLLFLLFGVLSTVNESESV